MACTTCGGNLAIDNPFNITDPYACMCGGSSDVIQDSSADCCGVISVNGKKGVVLITTTDIPEGSNLYFTVLRARAAISADLPITYNSVTGKIGHANSGVTPGTYGSTTEIPIVTVDQKGHVTNMQLATVNTGGGIGPDLTAIEALTGIGYLIRTAPNTWILRSLVGTVGQIDILNPAGTLAQSRIKLTDTGVTAGTYGNGIQVPVFTVDAQGRISSVTLANIPGVAPAPDRITAILSNNDFVVVPADKIIHGIILIGTPGETVNLGTTMGGTDILPSINLDGTGKFIDANLLYDTVNRSIYISGNTNPVRIILPL